MKRSKVFYKLVVVPSWKLSYWWNSEVIFHIPQNMKVRRVYNKINVWLLRIHVGAHRHWLRISSKF